MATIRIECRVHEATYVRTEKVSVSGNTREAIHAAAEKACAQLGGVVGVGVGLDNYRSDWEAIYGPTEETDTFADDLQAAEMQRYHEWQARESWFSRLMRRLLGVNL